MPQQVYQHRFANGLTLLAERMDHVRSAAFNFLVPSGCVYDPPELSGIGSMLADLITRGAGERDSRELTLALDNLGLDRSESVGSMHMRFWGATVASNLAPALEIYADILRRPSLPTREMDAVRALALQDIHGLEDEPKSKVLVELRKRYYPAPLGNDHRGTEEGINRIKIADLRRMHKKLFRAEGAILSVAGNIEWEPLLEQVGRLFGDWPAGTATPLELTPADTKSDHIAKKGVEQTQIAVAFDSVPFGHPDYYAALGAVNVLSGDMSSRLFTEIREKEGLCYSVWATYQTFKDRGAVVAYAGSRNDRAQRTLDLLLQELRRLSEGVEADEVERVKVSLKTSLVMQQESASSRAGSLASDWYYLSRVRSLDEISAAIDALTPQAIVEYVHRHPAQNFTVVTLGPRRLRHIVVKAPKVVRSAAFRPARLQFHHATLPNGLTVLGETNPAARSAALGFFVRTGARDETVSESGVSHFLEHMVFKGTPRRTAMEVNRDFSRIGADNNAFTSEENTVFHAAVLPEYLPDVTDIIADILRPSLRGEDFDMEKKVILEEIGMYEDQPNYSAYDNARKLHFGDHRLGNSVLGTAASITALTRDQMAAYFARRYVAPNLTVAAAGNFEWPRFVELVEKHCGQWENGAAPREGVSETPGSGGFRVIKKDKVVQEHIVLIAAGPSAESPLRYAADMLAMAVGDDSGSRLYWELVDPGFAESADLGFHENEGAGAFFGSLSCEPEQAEKNLAILLRVLGDVCRDGITDDELAQARSKVLSRLVRGSERPKGRMMALGMNWIYQHQYRSVDDDLKSFKAVTLKDVRKVLEKYPLDRVTTLALGPLAEVARPAV